MRKKLLIFAAIVIGLVSIACLSVSSSDILASGTCGSDGDNLIWELDCDGVLTIRGEGKMEEYWINDNRPWKDYDIFIKSIIIEEGVTSIGSCAFAWFCRNVESVSIADSVTSIGNYAFEDCFSVEKIHIGKNITTIGAGAFSGCSSLEEITVDSNNSKYVLIDGVLFLNIIPNRRVILVCYPAGRQDKTYDFPEGIIIHEIAPAAFSGATHLETIEIDTATKLGGHTFNGCTSLKSVTIGKRVTSIKNQEFYNCTALVSINVDDENEYFSSVNGVLFNKDKTEIIAYPTGKNNKEYSIPTSVTKIGDTAFQNCDNLISLIIPNTVTSIGELALNYIRNLETIVFDGTKAEWNLIIKDTNWDNNAGCATENGKYTLIFLKSAYGDATGDSIVDNKDLVRLKKYLAAYDYDTGTSSVEIGTGADANGDGFIDNKDLVRLKKYLAAYDYDMGMSSVPLGPTV